jgi:transposase
VVAIKEQAVARYGSVNMSPRRLPVDLEAQMAPGSLAHGLHHLVDLLDLSAFDAHYRTYEVDAAAHAPAMLKAVLLAYSQGIISSRSIERACRDNVQFIAIDGVKQPSNASKHRSGKPRRVHGPDCRARAGG